MTRKLFEIGGVVAAAVLIAFGIAAIVMSVNGHSTVNDSLKQEQITGTPDMTPAAIAPEVKADQAAQDKLFAQLNAAGVKMTPSPIETPTCSVAGKVQRLRTWNTLPAGRNTVCAASWPGRSKRSSASPSYRKGRTRSPADIGVNQLRVRAQVSDHLLGYTQRLN